MSITQEGSLGIGNLKRKIKVKGSVSSWGKNFVWH
jgi:hypothetical protein